MALLDRYIVRQFLINFVILLFVLIALVVLIDVVVNLDEVLEAGRRVAVRWASGGSEPPNTRSRGVDLSRWAVGKSTAWVLWDWYGPLVAVLYVHLSGLVVVAAMGFTFSDLARKGEIVAIVTSGLSMYRVAAPSLIVGGSLSAMALPIQEYVIPPLASKIARRHKEMGHVGIPEFSINFVRDKEGYLVSAAGFHPERQTLRDVHIIRRDEGGRPIAVITCGQALWNQRHGGWDLIDGYEQPIVLTGSFVSEPRPVHFFSSSLTPQVLLVLRTERYRNFLSIKELQRIAHRQRIDRRKVSGIIHLRFSMLVVNIMLMFIVLRFILDRQPVNTLTQSVRAAAMTLGTWGSSLVIFRLGGGHLNPIAAAWLPVLVYMPLSVWNLQKVRT